MSDIEMGFEPDAGEEHLPSFQTVCIVEHSLAYGGPEEGGWWYDSGEPQISNYFPVPIICITDEDIEKAKKKMQEWLDVNYPNQRELSSVLCHSRYDVMVFDYLPPSHYPAERPHYE